MLKISYFPILWLGASPGGVGSCWDGGCSVGSAPMAAGMRLLLTLPLPEFPDLRSRLMIFEAQTKTDPALLLCSLPSLHPVSLPSLFSPWASPCSPISCSLKKAFSSSTPAPFHAQGPADPMSAQGPSLFI
ncbi:uncharacterized protein LOC126582890 [Malus sylvestris]|uniref:uncharacterized protein LOC126582890 n=1 Tax=Malus sylvestris TaxID=3752 RepID=UPI0021ACF14B|nr:uncharacterized protein LOC126582890 [Malus sylvestris]